jgi:prepilin-type N-terminal cleavage/methylation domain-containing protein
MKQRLKQLKRIVQEKSNQMKHSKGFTVIELFIVVCVIGILAALAIFGVNQYFHHQREINENHNYILGKKAPSKHLKEF